MQKAGEIRQSGVVVKLFEGMLSIRRKDGSEIVGMADFGTGSVKVGDPVTFRESAVEIKRED